MSHQDRQQNITLEESWGQRNRQSIVIVLVVKSLPNRHQFEGKELNYQEKAIDKHAFYQHPEGGAAGLGM